MSDDMIRGILLERKRRARVVKTIILLVLYSALAVSMVIAVAAS